MNKLFKITMGAAVLAMFACSDNASDSPVAGGSSEDPNAIATDTSGVAKDPLPTDTINPPEDNSSDSRQSSSGVRIDATPMTDHSGEGQSGILNPEGMSPGYFMDKERDSIANFEVVPGLIEPTVKAIIDTSLFGGGNVYEFEEYLGAYSVCKTNGIDELRVFKVDSATSTFRTYIGTHFWDDNGASHMESDYSAFRKDCEDKGGTLDKRAASDYDDLLWCEFKFDDDTDLKKIWRGYADEFFNQCVDLSKDYIPYIPLEEKFHCTTTCKELENGDELCVESCPVM